jgi:hypothetical protein
LARYWKKPKAHTYAPLVFLLGAFNKGAKRGCAFGAPLKISKGAILMTASFWCVLDIAVRGI